MGIYDKYADEYIKLYNSGLSIRQISKKVGVNAGSISRVLKNHVQLRPKSNIPEDTTDIYNLYISGLSINEISKQYNCDTSSIKRVLTNKYGLNVVNTDGLKYKHLINVFKEEYSNGHSLQEISDKYSVSKQTIANYLNFENVPLRSYELSGRSFEVNDTYLDQIDTEEKAFVLGLLYGNAFLIKENTSKIINIHINSSELEDILFWLNKITSKKYDQLDNVDKTNNKALRINSSHIYNLLLSYGFKERLPLNILSENLIHSFLCGLLKYTLTINARLVNFPIRRHYHEDFFNYFKDVLNINLIMAHNKVVLENNKEITNLVKLFPQVIDSIQNYSKSHPNNTKWRNFLKSIDAVK